MAKIIEYEEDVLHPVYQFYYDDCALVRKIFDEEYNDKYTYKNDLIADIVNDYTHLEEVQKSIIACAHFVNGLITKEQRRNRNGIGRAINKVINDDKPKLWFITFTLEEDKSKDIIELKRRLITGRQRLLKKYKYIYVEEEQSADNKRYHQHIIVEGEYFNTTKNMRKADYYSGNINIKRIYTDNGIEKYLSKENNPKGDIDYIKDKLRQL